MPDAPQPTRCEIADIYFWLGAEAGLVGFTPWATAWLRDRNIEPLTAVVALCLILLSVPAWSATGCPPSFDLLGAYAACQAHHDSSDIGYLPPFDKICVEVRDKVAGCYEAPAAHSGDLSQIQKALRD